MATTGAAPVILIAVAREQRLARVLESYLYAVIQVHAGTLALEWARDVRPDAIILEADLPDMSGIEACRELHRDPRIGRGVPILILASEKPSSEQRVAALRAGAWDLLYHGGDPEELALKLQTYVKAKRTLDIALTESLVDPATGLHSRLSLARRARELGSLLARKHGALACVVFSLDGEATDPKAAGLIAQTVRISDVVGAFGPAELAVLAPATDGAGAVKLAQRAAGGLRESEISGTLLVPGATLRVGYDAVDNLSYAPLEPVELLARASAAVRHGVPEPGYAWVRRFEGAPTGRVSGGGGGGGGGTAPAIAIAAGGPERRGRNR